MTSWWMENELTSWREPSCFLGSCNQATIRPIRLALCKCLESDLNIGTEAQSEAIQARCAGLHANVAAVSLEMFGFILSGKSCRLALQKTLDAKISTLLYRKKLFFVCDACRVA